MALYILANCHPDNLFRYRGAYLFVSASIGEDIGPTSGAKGSQDQVAEEQGNEEAPRIHSHFKT